MSTPTSVANRLNPWSGVLKHDHANSLWRSAAAAALIYFCLCLTIQSAAGAWTAPFTSYPDEPGHFVGSIMVHDYLTSGFHLPPLRFARNYYNHYPFFALGHWPPLFYVISTVWYLVVGEGRFQAMILQAMVAAGAALLIFCFVRRRATPLIAFCVGLVYLGLPEVQQWLCAVMVDQLVALLCLATALVVIYYLEAPTLGKGICFALLAAAATLTKYNAAYICVLPGAVIVATRRFSLLRNKSFWIQPAIIAVLILPWWWSTRQFNSEGLLQTDTDGPFLRAVSGLVETVRVLPPPLFALAGVGLLFLLISPLSWKRDHVVLVLMYLGMAALLGIVPVGVERRYLLAGTAAFLILSADGWQAVLNRPWPVTLTPLKRVVIPAVVFAALCLSVIPPLNFPHAWNPDIHNVAVKVAARILEANPSHEEMAILLPTDLEGPLTAEFVLHDPNRPSFRLNRPSRMLSTSRWGGRNYRLTYQTVPELMGQLQNLRIDFVLLHARPSELMPPHDRILREGLSQQASSWRHVPIFENTGLAQSWELLQYVPEHSDVR